MLVKGPWSSRCGAIRRFPGAAGLPAFDNPGERAVDLRNDATNLTPPARLFCLVSAEISLYDLLGVAPQSPSSELRAAYYTAIKLCHPDVDPSPGAPELALKLIDAYRVLGDPERRKRYNEQLRLEASLFGDAEVASAAAYSDETARTEPEGPPAAAQPAAQVDHVEPSSVVDHAESAAAVEQVDPAAAVADVEPAAAASAQASPTLGGARRGWRRGWVRAAVAGLGFAAGFALLVLVVSAFRPPVGRAFVATALQPALALRRVATRIRTAARVQTAQARTPVVAKALDSPCYDLFNGLKGERLYRACVKARVKLHLRMMRSASGAELEQDELQDAIAEIRQAVGAAGVHMSSTHSFIEESIATFADVKNTAKDEQVRRIAENYFYYYSCEALKHCAQ
jgi:curved DNA-binding protein CbpA